MKFRYYKIVNFIIKTTVVIAVFGFIYKQIFYKEDLDSIQRLLNNMMSSPGDVLLLFLAILLMLVNWGLEAIKWKILIRKIEKISFLRSLKAIFSGVSVSIFTPNRIGEFGGRVFYLEKADRMQAVLITILGSMSQLLITIVFGAISFLIFINSYPSEINLSQYLSYLLIFIVGSAIVLLITIFLNVSLLTRLLNKFPFLSKYKKYSDVFSYYSSIELTNLLLLSFGRYIVFTLQFYLLLIVSDVNIPLLEVIMSISLMFFVMAVIPTIALTELGIRGSVAIYFIGMLSDNKIGILTSSFGLWIVNLAIPALIGAVFVLGLKFFRFKP